MNNLFEAEKIAAETAQAAAEGREPDFENPMAGYVAPVDVPDNTVFAPADIPQDQPLVSDGPDSGSPYVDPETVKEPDPVFVPELDPQPGDYIPPTDDPVDESGDTAEEPSEGDNTATPVAEPQTGDGTQTPTE